MEDPSLLSLGEAVLSLTQTLVASLRANAHPLPSFSAASVPTPISPKYDSIRNSINTAALDLLRLVNGPKETFRTLFATHYDLVAYQVALEFDFFTSVPLDGSILLSELAQKVGLAEDRVGIVMRFLATQRVFKESAGGEFQHTNASALLARQPLLRDVGLMQYDPSRFVIDSDA